MGITEEGSALAEHYVVYDGEAMVGITEEGSAVERILMVMAFQTSWM